MDISDSDLLQRFVSNGDQAAFTTLVGRHAGMVRGAAWRRTQDWTLAEEVAQNVFAILARKAGALGHEGLAGWLHRAAVLESVNAVRKAAHYRNTLHLLRGTMNETGSDFPAVFPSASDPASAGSVTDAATGAGAGAGAWEELRPHLDEAMARLPSEARHLVVLRYLERRPLAEVAAATGKNPEACRKRLQRSLRQLETLLRRRGVSPASVLSLAAVLASQPLCAPPASASVASLAASALKAAPALKLSLPATLTLHLMKTGSITKTAAITLTLAAIPVALLWHDNAGLRAANRELQRQTETPFAPAGVESPSASAGRKTPAAAADSARAGQTGAASLEAATDSAEEAEAAARKLEEIRKNGRNKALRLAETEFTRLSLSIQGLTPEQKTKIREALESKSLTTIQEILHAFESGAVASAVKNPEALTTAEKEALSRMSNVDPRKAGPPVIDEELKTILTPEQYATHLQAQESRRITSAEESAGDAIKFISRTFDLTADQKDRIFQQLAQLALTPEEKAPAAVSETDPFPEIGSREAARDRIIRANLTPEQAEVFDQKRAAEREVLRQQMMEFYDKPKSKPAAATAGGSEVRGG